MATVSMCLLVLSKVSSGPGSMQFGPDSLVVIGCQRHSCEMGLDPGAGYGSKTCSEIGRIFLSI